MSKRHFLMQRKQELEGEIEVFSMQFQGLSKFEKMPLMKKYQKVKREYDQITQELEETGKTSAVILKTIAFPKKEKVRIYV